MDAISALPCPRCPRPIARAGGLEPAGPRLPRAAPAPHIGRVSDFGVIPLPFPDAAARARIVADLDTNLLVEAGAGSGKTTALVSRMVALIASGTARVEELAAVTFTRKAAGELRERFQTEIERALRAERVRGGAEAPQIARLAVALDDVHRAFIGTIHAFCGRLLRERPLEVGLDPAFEELPVEERLVLRRRFWEAYLERLTRDSDPVLEDLSAAGLRPARLFGLFGHLVENPDVEFPAAEAARPGPEELTHAREELESIVDAAWQLMPEREPPRGWDSLQRKLRTLRFTRDVTGWREAADFLDALAGLCKPGPRGHDIVQNRWRDRALAKALCERVDAFSVGDTPANALLEGWRAHRYALAVRLARQAADEFFSHRVRVGRLDFQDLLVLAARLLRSNPGVRRALGHRYRRLLVDEFQDTDPIQAEIVILLASDPADEANGEPAADESNDEPGADESNDEPAVDGARAGRVDPPATEAGAEHEEWRLCAPRPGALFVVGDPKQSIYRFRRADIQLYGFVKERFSEFGEVVELTTSFRSRPAIGDLVNEVFVGPGFFPAVATPEQAAFEPLNTRPATAPVSAEGVFVYDIAPAADNRAAVAADDAARLATWIRHRVDAGERHPGDFLILTRLRRGLDVYASALEARGLPVQVTGAGVGVEEEIRELRVILDCIIDPTNPVKVVAALVGLFFAIDYERLVVHRLEGGGFDAMKPRERGHPDVVEALATLRSWWSAANAEPADVFVSRLVSELGLLPYAAAGELGGVRAGALVYALDAIRASALTGDASLPGAVAALQAALDLAEAEAPLEPERPDVVRLMNLHQAKGLEAPVVVLADPSRTTDRPPDIHTTRSADRRALGYLRVTETVGGFRQDKVLAVPRGWEEKESVERRFDAAEQVRLLYVAVTRAREELVVARWPGRIDASPWRPLHGWLDKRAEVLDLQAAPPEPRERVALSAEDARRAAADAAAALAARRVPSFLHESVTEAAKAGGRERAPGGSHPPAPPEQGFRGFSWGSAVHGALAAAAAGTAEGEAREEIRAGADADALRRRLRDLLVEHERPLDDHGEPVELTELLDLVRAVRASELWRRARAADHVLAEIPFAAPGVLESPGVPDPARAGFSAAGRAASGRPQLDLFAREERGGAESAPGAGVAAPARPVRVLEGVIDLAFREPDGWVIADYKTDVGSDPDFARRQRAYRRQVELYAEAWTRLTGEPVKERILFYTTQGRIESW